MTARIVGSTLIIVELDHEGISECTHVAVRIQI